MGRRSIVSDRTKYEVARELGFADKIEVKNGSVDYGNITTREAGLIVRRLIERAEEAMSKESQPEASVAKPPMPSDMGLTSSVQPGFSSGLTVNAANLTQNMGSNIQPMTH